MKYLLPFLFCSFSLSSFAQVHSAMPPEASSLYNYAMKSINPEIKNLIEREAHNLKGRNIDADNLINTLKKDPLLKKLDQHDIDAIAVLIMVQASKNADEDLKNLVMNMRKNNDQSSLDSNKTETILDQKSKMAKNISMVMKKISASQESAINNLK
jgi:hypothetical protein